MPQDDVAEIKEALLAARKGGDENPVFYRESEHYMEFNLFVYFNHTDELIIPLSHNAKIDSFISFKDWSDLVMWFFVLGCPNGHPYVIGNVSTTSLLVWVHLLGRHTVCTLNWLLSWNLAIKMLFACQSKYFSIYLYACQIMQNVKFLKNDHL